MSTSWLMLLIAFSCMSCWLLSRHKGDPYGGIILPFISIQNVNIVIILQLKITLEIADIY